MGPLVTTEAEERTASQTAVKGEGEKGWEGRKTMAEFCGEGSFSSSSALLRLSEQRIPWWLQAFRFRRWGCELLFSLRSQRVGNSSLPLISSTPSTCPLRALKAKVDGGSTAELQTCCSCCVLFSPIGYVYQYMTLLLSNTQSLLNANKTSQAILSYPLECRSYITSNQRTWQSPIQMAAVGKLSFL